MKNIAHFGNKLGKKNTNFAVLLQNNHEFKQSIAENIVRFGNIEKKKKFRRIAVVLQNNREFIQSIVKNIEHFGNKSG